MKYVAIVALIKATMARLSRDGTLIFSNNYRRFTMATDELPDLTIEDITARTISRDFERNGRIHNCWRITQS